MTLGAHLPIFMLLVLSSLFAIASIIASSRLTPRKRTRAKLEPYECGIVPEHGGIAESERFPVKFYVVAMLFIIFDIETVFLYPWAVIYDELKLFGLFEMLTFIGILVAAYAYVWKRGALEWAE